MRFWHSLIADCIIGKFLDFWSNGKTCDIFHSMDRTEWMGCIPARIYIHPGQALVFVCLCLSHMKRNWRPNRDLFVGQNGKVFFFFFGGVEGSLAPKCNLSGSWLAHGWSVRMRSRTGTETGTRKMLRIASSGIGNPAVGKAPRSILARFICWLK